MPRRGSRKPKITPEQRCEALSLVARHGSWIQGHLDRLRELPAHGNRTLHIDQLFVALLCSFFDPIARSLRLIEDAGDFTGQLELSRLARSTTSDALAIFNPSALKPIIEDLRRRVPEVACDDADLSAITRRIIAGDGSYISTLADVIWALKHTQRGGKKQGQVRANVQIDVASWVPQAISVSGDDGVSEAQAVACDLLEGVLYIFDRNFVEFSFIEQLIAKNNDFVIRVRANAPATRVVSEKPLTPADAAAGVVSDQLVELTGRDAPAGLFRLVTIVTTNRKGESETIRLLSNLIGAGTGRGDDVAAHVIGAIYRLRWQIELFFKWLKTWARMDHLLSTSRNGITFQLYVAVIAVLMIHVQTGRRVNVYTLAALGRYARGDLTYQQLMEVIERRNREADQNAARRARKRQQKKLA